MAEEPNQNENAAANEAAPEAAKPEGQAQEAPASNAGGRALGQAQQAVKAVAKEVNDLAAVGRAVLVDAVPVGVALVDAVPVGVARWAWPRWSGGVT